jgi:zinc transport system ATP-binding protein
MNLESHHGDDDVCLNQVSFAYDGQFVVENVTLHAPHGTTLGIIGPNGSGKTTLLKLMLGLLRPNAGSITVLGMPPAEACARGDVVGYVPQRHELDWSFPISARQMVELGLAGRRGLMGRLSAADRRRAIEQLAAVGLADQADASIGELSGGQQQRVFLARALVSRPRVLFLDEPTTGVDVGAQENLQSLLQLVKEQLELTLIVVSHNLRAITSTCDYIACLSRTVHYHDKPSGLSRELLSSVFHCDVEAMLDTHSH